MIEKIEGRAFEQFQIDTKYWIMDVSLWRDFIMLVGRNKIALRPNYVRYPQMSGYIERLNKKLKNKLLEYVMPETIAEANEYIHDYLIQYNFDSMHSGIGNLTPFEKFCAMKIRKPLKKIIETHLGLFRCIELLHPFYFSAYSLL
ncbi:MAG: integrase core domain-containing protein [Candidatus Dojkabacteria bacterium]|nr:integrase core domain-containing protein [Candidatus Dojkabacteria bacterium]